MGDARLGEGATGDGHHRPDGGHGFYGQHSLAQHSAGALGLLLLQRAVEAVATLDDEPGPVLIADLGAAGGLNEFAPMALAIDGLRAHAINRPITRVRAEPESFETVWRVALLRIEKSS
jgi:hypothetical protein